MSNDAIVEFIRGFFAFALGLGTTYLTVVYKNRRNAKRKLTAEDRETFLFDRYEKTILQVDNDLQIARDINKEQQMINQQQASQIEKMQDTIDTLRGELINAQKENRALQMSNIGLVRKMKPEES